MANTIYRYMFKSRVSNPRPARLHCAAHGHTCKQHTLSKSHKNYAARYTTFFPYCPRPSPQYRERPSATKKVGDPWFNGINSIDFTGVSNFFQLSLEVTWGSATLPDILP